MITVTYTQAQASGQIVQSFKRLVIQDRSPWCLLVFSLEQTVWLHIWSDMNLMHKVSEDILQKKSHAARSLPQEATLPSSSHLKPELQMYLTQPNFLLLWAWSTILSPYVNELPSFFLCLDVSKSTDHASKRVLMSKQAELVVQNQDRETILKIHPAKRFRSGLFCQHGVVYLSWEATLIPTVLKKKKKKRRRILTFHLTNLLFPLD